MKNLSKGVMLLLNSISPKIRKELEIIFCLLQKIEQRRQIEESNIVFFKKALLRLGILSYSESFKRLVLALEKQRSCVYSKVATALNSENDREFFELSNEVETIDHNLKLRLDHYLLARMGLIPNPFSLNNYGLSI